MHSFRIIADALLLHLAQKPLVVLAVLCFLMIAAAAVLVRRELRFSRSRTHTGPTAPEDTSCC